MLKTLKNLNELVLFQHTVFSLPFIFIAMIVGANGWFGWKLLLLGTFAAISARNFAMAFNRFVDRSYDKENPRTKNRPSVDGRLSAPMILFFMIANAIFFTLIAYWINPLAFLLSPLFLFILAFYSLVKRFSYLAHLFLGVALGLAPVAGAIAVMGEIPNWSLLLSGGVLFWVAGFDLLYALQDLEYDKERGLHSIPAKFGVEKTLLISRSFHIITVFLWALFVMYSNLGVLAQSGLIIAFGMLIYEHTLVSRGLENINKAFFTVNGYLGFIFLLFIILDFTWK
jgi:4-hydroxybenzoate polyprenyltransferase